MPAPHEPTTMTICRHLLDFLRQPSPRCYCRRFGIRPEEALGYMYLGLLRRLREPPRNLRLWTYKQSWALLADYAHLEARSRLFQD